MSTDTPAAAPTADAPPADTPAADAPTADGPAAEGGGSVEKSQADGAPEAMGGSGLREPEYDVEVTLSDLQADPNNPLYSVKSFEELNLRPEIIKGLHALNFRRPSKIQERALPLLMRDPPTNMIAQSQSGTGKTAAFVLNMLSRCDMTMPVPQALVLAPSRELARQIVGVVQQMGQFVQGLNVVAAVPDPRQRNQQITGQIVVGTPGTVMDMIRRRQMNARSIKILVVDEADNMLDQQGLGDQCKRVKALLPSQIQLVLFSATFPENVTTYARQFAPRANELRLKHEDLTVEGIHQFYLDVNGEDHKYDDLVKFYGLMTISSSIIFRRDTAREIEERMTAEGHQVAHLSGGLEGSDRDRVIDRFRSGEAKVLITTNVLARGIDVQSVTMVINYDVPEKLNGDPDYETYLHRIGRTGRFGRVGVAITFVHDKSSWSKLMDITKYFNVAEQLVRLDTNDWDMVENALKLVLKNPRAGVATDKMVS
ncbi:P-loop containing nucleoside triphosphate hydrolase protein [Lineolata rhizophorae]|uniref:RNA helicase n=1 Tax=Lineolata rhizophorae TaxID=578093 RepID=A0A6A6PFM0_9PEZI|nr:P-loop containing nucleoside triphosphate hydrolase protein [Lineolata rhizophorae]